MAEEQQSRKVTGKIHVDGELKIDFPDDVKRVNAAAEVVKNTRDRNRLKLEWWSFVVLASYAALTLWQSWSTQRMVTLTRDQFTKDQRPYIWYSGVQLDPLEVGKKVSGSVTLRNVGKSPALRFWIPEIEITYGPDAYRVADAVFKLYDVTHVIKEHPEYTETLLLPERDRDSATFITRKASNPELLTEDALNYIQANGNTVIFSARVFYTDMANNQFHTDFCLVATINEPLANCKNHNDIQ